MQKVSKIGLKMATGYKKCIEDRWTVKNLLVSAKGQLSTDRYKCLLQKSEEENPITKYDEAKVRFLGLEGPKQHLAQHYDTTTPVL